MKKPIGVIYCALLLTIVSCNNKFDKAKWNEPTDAGFPPECRSQMVEDLTSNYKLTGLACGELIDLLGIPDNRDSNTVVYNIALDYGWDIDPIYSKDLEFTFSKDSIITAYKIREWKH